MTLTLFTIPLSHPAIAARLMLEHKRLPYRTVRLTSGLHPVRLRLAGFERATVPALLVDGRRVQGSLSISRCLEDLVPEPALYPADPAARRHVEAAEAWGEGTLQDVPRRIFRNALVRHRGVRRALARLNGLPLPGVSAVIMKPLARRFARISGADDDAVARDLEALPSLLDDVDDLLRAGAIGLEEPNAASFQIAPTVRLLMEIDGLGPLFDDRPAARLATTLVPDYPGDVPAVTVPTPARRAQASAEVVVPSSDSSECSEPS